MNNDTGRKRSYGINTSQSIVLFMAFLKKTCPRVDRVILFSKIQSQNLRKKIFESFMYHSLTEMKTKTRALSLDEIQSVRSQCSLYTNHIMFSVISFIVSPEESFRG